MSHFNVGRLKDRVSIRFGSPDWNYSRNCVIDGAIIEEAGFEFDCIDIDHGVITVDEDLRNGCNETLAVRSDFTNEEGEECGEVAWRIAPSAELLEQRPDLARFVGCIFGRVYITDVEREFAPMDNRERLLAAVPTAKRQLSAATQDEILSLFVEVQAALEGDSNDQEHDALVEVASFFGIPYDPDAAE